MVREEKERDLNKRPTALKEKESFVKEYKIEPSISRMNYK